MATMMQLGATTFTQNPGKMTLPQAGKSAAVVQTYSAAAFFSWGTLLVGQVITLQWEVCPLSLYNAIHALLVADAAVNFIPGNGTTYEVEIMSLTGEYFLDQTATAEYRGNVKLELVILRTI